MIVALRNGESRAMSCHWCGVDARGGAPQSAATCRSDDASLAATRGRATRLFLKSKVAVAHARKVGGAVALH
ncbi:hypothetical protein VDR12_12355 [Xanthomonas campestris pv. campestris]|uniref:hypothetical protein n=1 Tax=Xanthomonas TaxID=338 RepID=UPI000A83A1CE|nr:hypothetical protein [Xanthomonas campestris]MBF9172966.1 hypothetical protein [Xanthomonas campestris pv. campestris]MCC5043874.1 hypothetical protein [Xanthomonas campestris]MEA0621638.1 hypothetical protein [Xanthomonas campestris pv. campestris]MEA0646377.1 hypothetical protein [Xanthomonas campestris pv. campestris]MEA0691215.1 hypothetical protein [Xanthomonas campestris pv. campestris]